MSDGFTDPNSGRYRGKDAETARAFRELQRQFQRLRMDPVYAIKSITSVVGTYWGIAIGGRSTADGTTNPGQNWGMAANPYQQQELLVNVMESPTNAAHLLRPGSVVVGSRRPGEDGVDHVFFMFATATAGIYTGGVTSGTGIGGPGGGGTDPGGSPGGSNTGGGIIIGGPGGGGGSGGGPDGSCPLNKTVTFAGCINGPDNETVVCAWNGAFWTGTDHANSGVDITTQVGGWLVGRPGGEWDFVSSDTCPSNGTYNSVLGNAYGDLSTAIVS